MIKSIFFNRYPGARRRRRKEAKEKDHEHVFDRAVIRNESELKVLPKRLRSPGTSHKDSTPYDVLKHQESLNSRSSGQLNKSWSPSNNSELLTTLTDIDEHRISSTVSVKRIKRADLNRLEDSQSPNKSEDLDNKSKDPLSPRHNSNLVRRSTVSVIRVSKSDLANSTSPTQPEQRPSASTVQSSTSSAVRVTRIPRSQSTVSRYPPSSSAVRVTRINRSQSTVNQPRRSLSINSIGVADVNKNVIKIKPMKPSIQASSANGNVKEKKGNGVTVTKIARRSVSLKDPLH